MQPLRSVAQSLSVVQPLKSAVRPIMTAVWPARPALLSAGMTHLVSPRSLW